MNMLLVHLNGLVVVKSPTRTLSKLSVNLSINRLIGWKKWINKESKRNGEGNGRSEMGEKRREKMEEIKENVKYSVCGKTEKRAAKQSRDKMKTGRE